MTGGLVKLARRVTARGVLRAALTATEALAAVTLLQIPRDGRAAPWVATWVATGFAVMMVVALEACIWQLRAGNRIAEQAARDVLTAAADVHTARLDTAQAEHAARCWERVARLGYWRGPTFVFYEPFTMPGGHLASCVDLSTCELGEGVSPWDFVHALTDPGAVLAPD